MACCNKDTPERCVRVLYRVLHRGWLVALNGAGLFTATDCKLLEEEHVSAETTSSYRIREGCLVFILQSSSILSFDPSNHTADDPLADAGISSERINQPSRRYNATPYAPACSRYLPKFFRSSPICLFHQGNCRFRRIVWGITSRGVTIHQPPYKKNRIS